MLHDRMKLKLRLDDLCILRIKTGMRQAKTRNRNDALARLIFAYTFDRFAYYVTGEAFEIATAFQRWC